MIKLTSGLTGVQIVSVTEGRLELRLELSLTGVPTFCTACGLALSQCCLFTAEQGKDSNRWMTEYSCRAEFYLHNLCRCKYQLRE